MGAAVPLRLLGLGLLFYWLLIFVAPSRPGGPPNGGPFSQWMTLVLVGAVLSLAASYALSRVVAADRA